MRFTEILEEPRVRVGREGVLVELYAGVSASSSKWHHDAAS